MGGLARQIPIIAVVFSIAGLGSLGLPLNQRFCCGVPGVRRQLLEPDGGRELR